MGWYFARSKKIGPLRLNFSKSGVGASVGVRGLRVGRGPRGGYVSGSGPFGLRFRAKAGTQAAAQFINASIIGYALGIIAAAALLYFLWPLFLIVAIGGGMLKAGTHGRRRKRW